MTDGTPISEKPLARKKPGPKPKVQDDTPKSGRIVMYVTVAGTIRPAIISKVHDEKTVDLTVFNSEGSVAVQHVKHESIEQEWIEDATDIAGSWHWPIR
jgi:hypothetical protein